MLQVSLPRSATHCHTLYKKVSKQEAANLERPHIPCSTGCTRGVHSSFGDMKHLEGSLSSLEGF